MCNIILSRTLKSRAGLRSWGLRGLGASADLRAGAASVTEVWIFRNKDLSLKADMDSNSPLAEKVKCKWRRIVTFHSPLSPFVKNFKSVRAKPFFQTLNRQYVFFFSLDMDISHWQCNGNRFQLIKKYYSWEEKIVIFYWPSILMSNVLSSAKAIYLEGRQSLRVITFCSIASYFPLF